MKVYITLKENQPIVYREHSALQHSLHYIPQNFDVVERLVYNALCKQEGGPFNLPITICFDKPTQAFAFDLGEMLVGLGVNKLTMYPCV